MLNGETVRAISDYFGPNHDHLLIQRDDSIIVYFWSNDKKLAVGFNSRTKLGGKFPGEVVEKVLQQPVVKCETFVASTSEGGSKNDLAVKPGDYIRVCTWDDKYQNSFYGLNQRTRMMGKIHTRYLTRID